MAMSDSAGCYGKVKVATSPNATQGEALTLQNTHQHSGKLPLHLIPPEVIEAYGEVLLHGLSKTDAYPERDYESGMSYSILYGKTLRHLNDFWKGLDKDEDSKMDPLYHALFNVGALVLYRKKKLKGLDDRPGKEEE
jgi:hypothetical protein